MIEATGERLALARSISDAFGLSNLLVHIELLSPGRRASSAHRHSIKEEIFMVLEGRRRCGWMDRFPKWHQEMLSGFVHARGHA